MFPRTAANTATVITLIMLIMPITVIVGCGPPAPQQQPRHDPFFDDDEPASMSNNLDDAETRWRKELEGERNSDPDALLTDDPPGKPDRYGDVAFKDETPPPPATFWEKMKAKSETVGRASFAALTVLVTLGMMVAPYLLL
jgi:hypothetical protein